MESEVKISFKDKEFKIQIVKREKDISNYIGNNIVHFFKTFNQNEKMLKPKVENNTNNNKQKRKSIAEICSPILGNSIFGDPPKNTKKRNSLNEISPVDLQEITNEENQPQKKRKSSFFGEEVVNPRRKSIPEGFIYNPSEVTEEMNQKLLSSIFTLKVDGELTKVYNGNYYLKKELYRVSENDSFPEPEKTWIPAEPKPDKGKVWSFWRPGSEKDKWIEWGFKRSKKNLIDGYYMVIGKGIRGNLYNRVENACFSPFGTIEFIIPKELRNFEGIKAIVGALDIEGLVLTYKNEVTKITKLGYGLKWVHGDNVLQPDITPFIKDLNEVDDRFQHTERKWINENNQKYLRIMQYNLLSPNVLKPQKYQFTDSKFLHFEYRKEGLLMEILFYHPDLMTFQEMNFYEAFWKIELEKFDYKSLFYFNHESKMQHGCAIFWKKEYELIDYKFIDFNDLKKEDENLKKNNVAIVALLKKEGKEFIISTSHLYWNWKSPYIRIRQLSYLYDILNSFKNDNIIFAGDLNTLPTDPLYEFMTKSTIELVKDENFIEKVSSIDLENDVNIEKRKLIVKEILEKKKTIKFKSSYKEIDGEPLYTAVSPEFEGTLDYILFHGNFESKNILTLPKRQNIPNEVFSSDHFSILSELSDK